MEVRKTIVKKLYQLINWLNKENPNSDSTNNQIDSLAPKILTEEKDVNKIKPYLDSLKKVIEAKNITNIALTGNYGSGKSTILKTFQYLNPNHTYLNISLASFKDNNNEDVKLERKLEISILQQIFYHVKPSEIPDSRFKRIINLTTRKLWGLAISFILWLISLVILFKFEYIEKLNPQTWNIDYNLDWLALLSISIFFLGIGLFSQIIIRLFSNSKINKFNIKGELELGNDIDKSVFNKHLEEIIYFFERTNYNIIIIEDLDRFESTDIFTKLREINILLNSSELIHREINFIYAIRDEMFTDKSERVKFFEYIIPVIPFINPSNAGEQLAKLITNANLENVLTKDFTEDIVTFIDDIDMRLLTNIFHEYQLYKNNLSNDLNQDNLFAIIVYKNMFPDDFGLLHKRDGKLYKFIANKDSYIKGLLENINNKIVSSQTSIDIIKKESTDNISDLKSIYINAIHLNIPRANSLIIEDEEVLFSELVKDNYFDLLENISDISYYQFTLSTYYSNRYDKTTKYSNISFSDIENYVNREFTYQVYNIIEK